MFIKELKTKNFKVLKGENTITCNIPDGKTLGSGLNIFVGENNSGKSSVMEAMYHLRQKSKKDLITLGLDDDNKESYTEITFTGENLDKTIDTFVQENKKEAFKSFIYTDDEGKNNLTLKRLTANQEQSKTTYFYSQSDDGYKKNPGGLDASIQAFFQISNIWADTNPTDEMKYGASTICGNLLSDISDKFKIDHKDRYDAFITEFNKTFNDPKSGLQGDLNLVARETEEILKSQFGEAVLDFKFDDPEPDLFFKRIKILVDDGEKTEINEKGHGMQRAVMLSLLQVYSKRITEFEDEQGDNQLKPHFLFIDEPELGLHPQAQQKLFNALLKLSKTHQVFISTHSENFISVKNLINIHKFSITEAGSPEVLKLDNNDEISLPENRKFFLHHHKLFFTKQAVFVEGADDYDAFSQYLENTNNEEMIKDCYFIGGCSNFKMFEDFCKKFNITCSFVFDVDVLSVSNNVSKKFPQLVRDKVKKLNKTVTKKNPENLLDENLTDDEITLKNEMISDLENENIFVLKDGAIENYMSDIENDNQTNKLVELNGIFEKIKKLHGTS